MGGPVMGCPTRLSPCAARQGRFISPTRPHRRSGDWLQQLVELQPGLTITRLEKYAGALFSPEMLAVYIDGFRKAGLLEE